MIAISTAEIATSTAEIAISRGAISVTRGAAHAPPAAITLLSTLMPARALYRNCRRPATAPLCPAPTPPPLRHDTFTTVCRSFHRHRRVPLPWPLPSTRMRDARLPTGDGEELSAAPLQQQLNGVGPTARAGGALIYNRILISHYSIFIFAVSNPAVLILMAHSRVGTDSQPRSTLRPSSSTSSRYSCGSSP